GARQRADGRIIFNRQRIEAALKRASHTVQLPGFDENRGIEVGTGNVHIGTGGAAVQILDASSGEYRDSTLADLRQMMQILDVCENVHYGIRPLVARDMPTPLDLDINTAYACLATSKPIGISVDNAGHVKPVTQLFDIALGGEDRFRRHPFCFGVIVHVVSPLRFAREGVEIMRAAIAAGMPLQICNAAQAGATSPASLAGSLAQGLAEAIAGTMVVDAIRPGHPCIYAFLPFISDLRTGAMTGGSGESALTNAAAAQLLQKLDMPATVSAGMTDSKREDVQAGYEKGYSIALAAQAGAGMINLSVGMLGSIMVASPETLLIDNDMCGAILRTVRGIEVSDEMLDIDSIERVVSGEGHFLGEPQTLQLMKTEYVYPGLGDRQSVADWIDSGSETIWHRAQDRVQQILQQGAGQHLAVTRDNAIRNTFNIKLERGAVQ
ncbi:MAG: trimethylamine methyltransferase family protein, partial [Gammaproteobacteria bacterium]|nr:trimethylamine methyltransferase family protein [Gammaproteobacteria bacterium]